MADDKKISAKEAGIAVLKKFEELLTKAEKEGKHIGWAKLHSKLEHEGYSKESADKIDGSIKAKMNKDEVQPPQDSSGGQTINSQIGSPFGKADPETKEKVEGDKPTYMGEDVKPMGEEGHFKGHIKLAKFLGHMEGKRSAKVMPDSGNSEPTQKVDSIAGVPDKKLV